MISPGHDAASRIAPCLQNKKSRRHLCLRLHEE
nr:MAG TPA: hypothetical protein [Caudoviricetes sp.]